MKVSCPKCGSEEISAVMDSRANCTVADWKMDGGSPCPEYIEPPDHPEWDFAEVRNQYVCDNCDWAGNSDDLTFEL